MKIKRLEIVGFKSFVDKVSLDFQQGITGVVGPNGCGKSNIIDAIRWVMGEQNARNLRGRAMEDVIFGGSENRKPLGMAEVSIVFDNSAGLSPPAYRDYAEIMVTRRLYRNGDSDYLLNKTACRLLDITELFMDTGVGARAYSIIEQGKVGMLVSSKPEDRRAVIEEAAGVTKFKSRKKTSLRKMDATKQNLVRLSDVISEVRRNLGSLKRQAQRAETFREQRSEAKRIEISLAGNRYRELQLELTAVSTEEQARSHQLEKVEAQLVDGDLQIEERQLALASVEEVLARSQEKVYQLSSEVQRVEGELVLASRQRENLLRQDDQLQEEQREISERLESSDYEEKELKQSEEKVRTDLQQTEQRAQEAEKLLSEHQQLETDLSLQLEAARRQLMELLSDVSRLTNRREEIVRRLAAEEERQERNRSESVRLQEQMEEQVALRLTCEEELISLQSKALDLNQEQEVLQEQLQLINSRLVEAEAEVSATRQLLERQRSRLESLQELEKNLDGYTEGVRVLFAENKLKRQVAADFLQVEPAHELAIEMALGERLQSIPVDGPDQLDEVFTLLRDKGARATLLLESGGCEEIVSVAGAVPMSELVTCKGTHAARVKALLAGTFLVETLTPFYGKTLTAGTLLVTPAGDCLSWRGDLIAGAPVAASSGLLRKKREIDELTNQVAQLESLLTEQQYSYQQFQEKLARSDEDIKALSAERHRQELRLLERQKDQDRIVQKERRLLERLELLSFEEEQLHDERQRLLAEQDEISQGTEKSSARQILLEQQADRLQKEQADARSSVERVRETLTALRVDLASLRERRDGSQDTLQRLIRSREELAKRKVLLQSRREEGGVEKKRLEETDRRLRIELDLLLQRREEQQSEEVAVRERFEQDRQQLEALRDQQREVRSLTEERRKEVSRLQLRHRELFVDAEHMRESVEERYRVDLNEHQVPEATESELERQQVKLKQLLQRIEALGEVNLTAIDEYQEQEERYDFLTKQRDDLHQSLDDLQKAINKINRTTKRRFKETFDQVNEKFQQVFPRLFRGGQAELKLTDEDDLLQSGIEIVVQPPGKRLQSVNLLSGGEKALTAVALIFSLFLIKPTPFCVLDEVDAPLDDANIDRFAEMVREMAETSQFIIITHSKRTMANTETLYGVTMEQPGVSKIVSVRMNDGRSQGEAEVA
ncbi:MAG TPA: chromosome segregation protein SMC [Geopsychrobacteraceae bacterium]|nr:chromosome segregation protein SMC [Geopsychrobacteraceae bacterium]